MTQLLALILNSLTVKLLVHFVDGHVPLSQPNVAQQLLQPLRCECSQVHLLPETPVVTNVSLTHPFRTVNLALNLLLLMTLLLLGT